MKKGTWLLLILLISLIINVFLIYRLNTANNHGGNDTILLEERDTLILFDTITISKPVPTYIYRHHTDTVVKFLEDSTEVIPFETKVYQDTNYTAVVSGYKPSLDSLSFSIPSKIITVEQTKHIYHKKPFTFGVQLGVGYGLTSRKPDIYIGLGGQYNF